MNAISEIVSAPEAGAMDASHDMGKLFAALAQAQALPLVAGFNRVNPHFKNKYADLGAVWEVLRAALPQCGLAVAQLPSANGKTVSVRTVLGHAESGQWIASTVTAEARDPTPQSLGSAITYLRRYGLCAMVGVVADDDDDGEAAQPSRQQRSAPPPPRPQPAPVPEGASPWLIVSSSDGSIADIGNKAEWVAKWRFAIGAVEKSQKGTPQAKRDKLAAMISVNNPRFTDLVKAGEQDAVRDVTGMLTAADGRLANAASEAEPAE